MTDRDEPRRGRVPPHSREAEQSVLGAMLLSRTSANQALAMLTPDHFYEPAHGLVFECMQRLTDRADPIDVLTVAEELRQKDRLEAIGGHERLADLSSAVPNISHTEQYARTVLKYARRRDLIAVGQNIVALATDLEKDSTTVFDQAERMVLGASSLTAGEGLRPVKSVIDEAIAALEQHTDTDTLMTDLIDLDNMLHGFRGGQFVVVAARPSMGKSAFVQTIAMNAAQRNKTVAMFNLEMSNAEVMTRLLSMVGRVNATKLRSRSIHTTTSDHLWDRIINAASEISDWQLFLDDAPEPSTTEIRAKCRRLKQERGALDLVIVDYLQLMPSTDRNRGHDNRQQEIAAISREMKALARELDIPVVGVSQLNRAVEMRKDKRPMLSDLRESGAIEQDADIVLFLYRDEYYTQEPSTENIAEVSIGKNRNGPTGKIQTVFRKEYTLFLNYTPTAPYPPSHR